MTSLHNISVQLSNGQKRNLARAYQKNEEVVTLLLFCPKGPLGHLIFSRASGYYANKTSSFKFGGNG